ncbi:MAG: sulfatase-like hydrolase/transferase [Macellibacteroides fermentans]|uniref:sulfatase-like hydrolase/transferase n=1 Tax=Macellibacteroides fermentans TaxID=879969 RepID=UPI003AD00AD4
MKRNLSVLFNWGFNLLLFPVYTIHAQSAERPNVIYILADDIGYGDFGCYGASKIKTPSIDKLASEGVLFKKAYAPASTSSPSRYALLTGEYAWRKNVGILPADAPLSISKKMNTLPKMFQKAGYSTGIVGKWHLGLGDESKTVDFNKKIKSGPDEVGFDYTYFFPATNDRVPCVFIENGKVVNLEKNDPIEISYKHKVGNDPTGKENPELLTMPFHSGHNGTIVNGISRIGWMSGGIKARWSDENMAQHLCNKAIEYIERDHKYPFFLYYAPQNAHEPRVSSSAFRGKSEAGLYGDVIEELDFCVGEVVKSLKKKGIYENTIIIITSDNGPMIKEGYKDGALENINGHDPYAKLRGEKYSLNEAGTRVPFIFSWPSKISHPFQQNQPFIYLDMLSTFADLINYPLGESDRNDSKSGAALFLTPDAPTYREYIMTQNNGGQIAIQKNGWKLIPANKSSDTALYDLSSDPSELHDLQLAYPEKVNELMQYVNRDYRR